MDAKDVLVIVLREMTAYGQGWRNDWYNFDGRQLRKQLGKLADWAGTALLSAEAIDYDKGTKFMSGD